MAPLHLSCAAPPLPGTTGIQSSLVNRRRLTTAGGGKWLSLFLLCFTVAIYAKPEDIFPALVPLHFPLVFGVCAGLAYFGVLLSGKIRLIWTREVQIVLLLTAWYIVGVPWAFWRSGSLLVLEQVWLKTLFIFFLLTQTLVNLPRIRKLLWAIILSELVVASFSIFTSSKAAWAGERLFGVNLGFLGWNFLGVAVSTTVPYIAVFFVSRPSLLTRALLLSTLAATFWMLALTASRGGLLNVFLSIILTAGLVLRGGSRSRIFIVVLGLSLVIACSLAPGVLWERLGTLWGKTESSSVAASAEKSTEGRMTLLKRSLEYVAEHPIFGVGLGNFGVVSGTVTGTDWMATHNTFTQVASEGGIPAFILFVALLIVVLRRMNSAGKVRPQTAEESELRLMARATQVSVISFMFGCFFANLAYDYYLFYLVAVAVGIQTIASTNRQLSSVSSSDSPSRVRLIPSVKNS